MKATKVKKVKITLEMDEFEAEWLMGMLQNGHPNEGMDDSETRGKFFNTLKRSVFEDNRSKIID